MSQEFVLTISIDCIVKVITIKMEFDGVGYTKINVLGRGAFATCWRARNIMNGRLFAIKVIDVERDALSGAEKEDMQNEIELLSNLNHPNIIQYVSSYVAENRYHIVMEYARGGSLHDVVKEARSVSITEDQIWEWFAQIALALSYVHSRNILHRDIKTQNLLLWDENRRVVKIADFGIAKMVKSQNQFSNTFVGTPYYLSPEICEGKPYSSKSDIWSLGVVMYELMTLKRPFTGDSIPSLILSIYKGRYEPINPNMYSSELIQLVDQMLTVDPNTRPSMSDVCSLLTVAPRIALWKAIEATIIDDQAKIFEEEANTYVLNNRKERKTWEHSTVDLGATGKLSSLEDGHSVASFHTGRSPRHLTSSSRSNLEKQWSRPSSPLNVSRVRAQQKRSSNNPKTISVASSVSSDDHFSGPKTLASMDDLSARLMIANFIAEGRRVYRWGGGQRKPTLEEKLFGIAIEKIASPKFLEADDEERFYLALDEYGKLYSWGSNKDGQLGHGHQSDIRNPSFVQYFTERCIDICDIACSNYHSAVVSHKGQVYVWGDIENSGGSEELSLCREDLKVLEPTSSNAFMFDKSDRPDNEATQDNIGDWLAHARDNMQGSENSGKSNPYANEEITMAVSQRGEEDSSNWPTWARNNSKHSAEYTGSSSPFAIEDDTMGATGECGEDSSNWPTWARKNDMKHSAECTGASNPFASEKDSMNSTERCDEDSSNWPTWARNNNMKHSAGCIGSSNPFASEEDSKNSTERGDENSSNWPTWARNKNMKHSVDNMGDRNPYASDDDTNCPVEVDGEGSFSLASWAQQSTQIVSNENPFGYEVAPPTTEENTEEWPTWARKNHECYSKNSTEVNPFASHVAVDDLPANRSQEDAVPLWIRDQAKTGNTSKLSEKKIINRTIEASVTSSSDDPSDIVIDEGLSKSATLKVGDRIHWIAKQLKDCGTLRFMGTIQGKPGIWAGIELDEAIGKNNGTVDGVAYFSARENHGVFVKPQSICTVVKGAPLPPVNPPRPKPVSNLPTDSPPILPDVSTPPKVPLVTLSSGVREPVSNPEEDIEFELVPDKESSLPRLVSALKDHFIVEISCGMNFVAVLSKRGVVLTWGENDYGQLGVGHCDATSFPMPITMPREEVIVKSITCGAQNMLMLTGTGSLYSWGYGGEGQLGWDEEVFDEPQPLPRRVNAIPNEVIFIDAGARHCAAITVEGEVYTWGCGEAGQLGHGNYDDCPAPQLIESLSRNVEDVKVVQVSCGAAHTMVLTDCRNVYVCGSISPEGHLDSTPRSITSLSGAAVVSVEAGSYVAYALSRVENPQDGL